MARTKGNSKPKLRLGAGQEWLVDLSKRVQYTGNPVHKKNPGDFGLNPPSSPRADKTLCDQARIFQKEAAAALLREAVLKGMISEQERNGFPQQIWAVSTNGIPLEAQLENQNRGTYHGYPLLPSNPLWREVLTNWEKTSN
jgi:hypothetical protein